MAVPTSRRPPQLKIGGLFILPFPRPVPTHGSLGLPKAVDVRQALRFGREHAELRAWSAGAQPVARVGSIWKLAGLLLFPVLRCELQRSKEREPLWNCRAGDLSVPDTRPDFLHEFSNKDHPTPSNTFPRLAAAVNEQRDLIDVLGNRHTWKQPRNVLAARLKFLRVPNLPLYPAVRVKGWFDLDQRALLGVEPDNVKLALVASFGSLANLHVPTDEVPAEFVPFGDQRFKVIPRHVYVLVWLPLSSPRTDRSLGISILAVPVGTVIPQATFPRGPDVFVALASSSRHRLRGSQRGRTDRAAWLRRGGRGFDGGAASLAPDPNVHTLGRMAPDL